MYIGFMYSMCAFGPVCGFLLGAYLLSHNVDTFSTDIHINKLGNLSNINLDIIFTITENDSLLKYLLNHNNTFCLLFQQIPLTGDGQECGGVDF